MGTLCSPCWEHVGMARGRQQEQIDYEQYILILTEDLIMYEQ